MSEGVLARNGIDSVDVVFSCGATMHVNDEIFAAARQQALKIARKAVVHLEYHAWTPAELQSGRNWRSSFLSDRWIRGYIAEYESQPGVPRVEYFRIPPNDQHCETHRPADGQRHDRADCRPPQLAGSNYSSHIMTGIWIVREETPC
jgi:hypothetical protein